MFKIAAIDVGSNAMRMVVGEVDESWRVNTLENVRLPVRLGQDVFSRGTLEKATIQQTEEAFLRFRHMAENYNVQKMRAVATSAAREASNGDLLIDRVFRASGIELELISGEEEARLIHQAVIHVLNLKNKRTLVIDIGGGSIEVTISTGQNIVSTESYNMGTVRLLEKLDGDHGSRHHFAKLVREYAEAARYRIERDIGDEKIQVCAGTGGNVEEIGRLRQKLFKGDSDQVVMLDELKQLIERLDRMTYEERIARLKLRPDRADVILPASVVLHMIASEAGVKQIAIPNVGLKDGILLDIAEELSRLPQPHRREQAWESALHMGRKYQFDETHALLTAKVAARLFEQSKSLHDLDESNLLLLEMAALLHDIGHFINSLDHEKHGYYLLSANRLFGLSAREQRIVASLVLYHRKLSPSTDDENFKALPQKDRIIVNKLSALLRLADAIDVSHSGSVSDVALTETKSGWRIRLHGRKDLMLATWALANRRSLFEDVFGVNLVIQ
jgi:exopolyphosphatase / guanosine-5'-triphosphate,3'-diphosphate pyrophosphatase